MIHHNQHDLIYTTWQAERELHNAEMDDLEARLDEVSERIEDAFEDFSVNLASGLADVIGRYMRGELQ